MRECTLMRGKSSDRSLLVDLLCCFSFQSVFYNFCNKEGYVLFNDALNTFYGVSHMVKEHSDSERGNPLPPHGMLFPISSKGSFICTIPDRITHTTAFVKPVVEHWLQREIAQLVHRSVDPSYHGRTLLPHSYISLLSVTKAVV